MRNIAVFGHHHSGTTCIARCLIQAGIDFGKNLNEALEDHRLIKLDHMMDTGWNPRTRRLRDDILYSVQGLKHPYLAKYLDGWEERRKLSKIVVIRNPITWIFEDYMFANEFACLFNKGFNHRKLDFFLDKWAEMYKPVLGLDCPVIFFDEDDTEQQIEEAFKVFDIEYKGGYVTTPPEQYNVEWTKVSDLWNGLRRKHLTKK